jgi:hypothetical protein
MDDRHQLDQHIRALTAARRDQVEARAEYQAAQRKAEEARVRAQEATKAINVVLDRMTAATAAD